MLIIYKHILVYLLSKPSGVPLFMILVRGSGGPSCTQLRCEPCSDTPSVRAVQFDGHSLLRLILPG